MRRAQIAPDGFEIIIFTPLCEYPEKTPGENYRSMFPSGMRMFEYETQGPEGETMIAAVSNCCGGAPNRIGQLTSIGLGSVTYISYVADKLGQRCYLAGLRKYPPRSDSEKAD
jgi:hypothetical protein